MAIATTSSFENIATELRLPLIDLSQLQETVSAISAPGKCQKQTLDVSEADYFSLNGGAVP
jgi:hypothetical protein